MSVTFVHTADLHLGSPLQTVGQESSEVRGALRDATYEAFERTIDLAIEEMVDFVIIAGDLYDQESRSVRANNYIINQFERLNDESIPCYLIYGNHDPLGERGELLDLPDNVYTFGHEEPTCKLYPTEEDPQARIYGQSYRTSGESRSMYQYFTPPDGSIPNIGILHTCLNPDETKYVPCSRSDLEAKNDIHYWALGHIHNPLIYPGTPTIAFPGIPQSRQITEPRVGGCLLVEVDTTQPPQVEFVPTSPVVWDEIPVSIENDGDTEDANNLSDLQTTLERSAEDIGRTDPLTFVPKLDVEVLDYDWSPEGFICRWRLTGRGSIHDLIQEEDDATDFLTDQLRQTFASQIPFVWTESVRDRTAAPLPNTDDIRETDPIFGEILDIIHNLKSDPVAREKMRSATGWVWYEPDDPEDERDERLPLTEDGLDMLVEIAEDHLIDELLARREVYVDS